MILKVSLYSRKGCIREIKKTIYNVVEEDILKKTTKQSEDTSHKRPLDEPQD